MADLIRCKKKLQLTVTFLCATSLFIIGFVGGEDALSRHHPKISLPPSTSSVKCHCQAIDELHDDSQSTKTNHPNKDIEIQIFTSEKDKQESEAEVTKADRRRDNDSPQSDGNAMQDSLKELSGYLQHRSFKAYKNVNLFGEETYPSHSSGNVMFLGLMPDAFKGPRRKRRDVVDGREDVFYVYPVNYYGNNNLPNIGASGQKESLEPSLNLDYKSLSLDTHVLGQRYTPSQPMNESPSNQILSDRNFNLIDEVSYKTHDPQYKDRELNKAMQQAWNEYGIKSPMRKQISDIDQVQNEGSIAEIVANSFQPTGSEWDDKMTTIPVSVFNRDTSEPSYFSSLLTKYINFEVNNHEVADFGRKLIFGLLIGILIAAWIGIGMFFGIIPIHWLIFNRERTSESFNGKRNTADGLSEITDKIILSLDSEWLKKLEERVKKDPRGNFIRTHARCCILPTSKTNGMADCQLVRKSRASNPFKCLSDLIYNFEFGEKPKDPTSTTPNSISESMEEFR